MKYSHTIVSVEYFKEFVLSRKRGENKDFQRNCQTTIHRGASARYGGVFANSFAPGSSGHPPPGYNPKCQSSV